MKTSLRKAVLWTKKAALLAVYGIVLVIALVIAAIARVPDATPERFRHKDHWDEE